MKYSVVVGAEPAPAASSDDVESLFARFVEEGRSRREAVKEIARLTGLPARDVYKRVLPQPETEQD